MILPILRTLDHRYPTAKEKSELLNFVATASARYEAIQELRGAINEVADYVVQEMKRRYPEFTRTRPQGFEKGRRDIALLTAFAGNAMFLGETETLDDQFTHWYRSILRSVHLSPQFMIDTFEAWVLGLKKRLSNESYVLMKPVVEHLVRLLRDLPEPVRYEDGERLVSVT